MIRALAATGFGDIAGNLLAIQKLRVSGDTLQTSAIALPGGRVLSAVNDPNDYSGPGTGYRLSPERRREIAAIPQAPDPRSIGAAPSSGALFVECGEARPGTRGEVVIAVGPAFGTVLAATLLGLAHRDVLAALMGGIEEEGLRPRLVKIYSTSDCGFVGHSGAQLSGSGIAVGMHR